MIWLVACLEIAIIAAIWLACRYGRVTRRTVWIVIALVTMFSAVLVYVQDNLLLSLWLVALISVGHFFDLNFNRSRNVEDMVTQGLSEK